MPEPPEGSIVQARIHRNIAKQRLPGKPTDLRQFPDHSLPGAFFSEDKNHIENRATSETVWAQFIFWCGKFEYFINLTAALHNTLDLHNYLI